MVYNINVKKKQIMQMIAAMYYHLITNIQYCLNNWG